MFYVNENIYYFPKETLFANGLSVSLDEKLLRISEDSRGLGKIGVYLK